jgi:hypothetical protein
MKHKKRYDILNEFFTDYNFQIPSYHFDSPYPCGYCGVIELFINMKKENRKIDGFIANPENYSHDRVIRWYFTGLAKELKMFPPLS